MANCHGTSTVKQVTQPATRRTTPWDRALVADFYPLGFAGTGRGDLQCGRKKVSHQAMLSGVAVFTDRSAMTVSTTCWPNIWPPHGLNVPP